MGTPLISPRSITPEVVSSAPRQASPSPPQPVIPISPYNPLTTPSFCHSFHNFLLINHGAFLAPVILFTSLPVDVSLGMIMCEQASPSGVASVPLAIHVSPVILALHNGKSSSFNTSGVVILGKGFRKEYRKANPLPVVSSGSLPTPITERLSLDQPCLIEESPLIRFRGRRTPQGPKMAMFTYAQKKMSGARIPSPMSLGEDPFGNLNGTAGDSVKPFSGRMVPTPLLSSNTDSPVGRDKELYERR
ncbi:hypothetical protein BJY52DRAFT_653799 [Lactarius psammicola]|nr:hypothetical protein BJY52DRAFT_653799 [Lactarius psammicola]